MLPAAQNAVSAGKNNWKPACAVGAQELDSAVQNAWMHGEHLLRMPCIYLHGMSLVVVVFLVVELILYAELNVETYSCWIVCGNTGDTLGFDLE